MVLSVPYDAQEATIAQIVDGCQGKVLITVGVPLKPPKVSTVWHPAGGSAAQEAQAQLGPEVRVVAAFQNIAAGHLRDLSWKADCDVLITGDDKEAKRLAAELVEGVRLFCRGRRSARQCLGAGRPDRAADRHQHSPQGHGQRHPYHGHPTHE